MKRLSFLLCFCIAVCSLSPSAHATDISLVEDKEIVIDMGIDLATEFTYEFLDRDEYMNDEYGFNISSVVLALAGEYLNSINFDISSL